MSNELSNIGTNEGSGNGQSYNHQNSERMEIEIIVHENIQRCLTF